MAESLNGTKTGLSTTTVNNFWTAIDAVEGLADKFDFGFEIPRVDFAGFPGQYSVSFALKPGENLTGDEYDAFLAAARPLFND